MFVNLHITTKTCNSMAMYITYKTCNYTKCNEQNVILFTASFSKHGLCPMCASAGSFLSSLYSPPDRFSSPSSLLPPLAGTIYKKERKKEMREKTVTWTFLTFAIFSQRHFLNSLICLWIFKFYFFSEKKIVIPFITLLETKCIKCSRTDMTLCILPFNSRSLISEFPLFQNYSTVGNYVPFQYSRKIATFHWPAYLWQKEICFSELECAFFSLDC